MKILYIHSDSFGGRGGIAQYNRDLLNSLASHPATTLITALPRMIVEPTGPVPAKIDLRSEAAHGKVPFLLAELATLLRPQWYDLVICGHIRLLPLLELLKLRRKIPIGLALYGIDAWEPVGGAATQRQLRSLDWFLSIAEITRERFVNWSGVSADRGFILPNAVDISRYTPGPKRRDLISRYKLTGSPILMTLGRLIGTERYKGIDEVLEALPVLARRFPNINYLICGDGPDRPRLEQKAHSLGVGDRVVFTGYVEEAEKIDHYRLADCFILAGSGEGFGFVLIEAMACGVPVVASCLDGSREAVANGELGVIVNPKEQSDLVRGIEEALAKPRGVVPSGLDRFSYKAFEKRVHQFIIDPLLA